MIDSTNHRGIAYLALGWGLTSIAILLCIVRLYSRAVLTRSVGSDDFAILMALGLILAGDVGDTMAVSNGFGQHESLVPPIDIRQFQKWTNIDWIMVFICFFFIRASVLLFVLRLLPDYKHWQKNVILAAFATNITISLIGTVSYGLSCRPFRAWYQEVPDAKCFSKHNLVITTQVNGVLSCLVDIVTAFIPQVLLWNVQMKKSTKRGLNFIFSLGLITSGLSIARVSTISDKVENKDSTFRMLVSGICSLVEAKMGIICACGPAIRQFIAYIRRTGTAVPSASRQYPNEDFAKMRRRINLRDLFWYQAPRLISGRVLDAFPVRTQRSGEDVEATAQRSVLGDWRRNLKGIMFSSHSAGNTGVSSKSGISSGSSGNTVSQQEYRRIGKNYEEWGLAKNQRTTSSNDTQSPTLNVDRRMLYADRDYELANVLAHPAKAAQDDGRHSFLPIERN